MGSITPSQLAENPRPAARVAGRRQDVWSNVNAAAAASPKQPIVNMGQGFFGYAPPQFIVDAAIAALGTVDCNQYSPTRGRPRLQNALAKIYSEWLGRDINPRTEVTVTTGANEVELYQSQLRYISNIQMPGGKVVYVPLHPPKNGSTVTSSSSAWTLSIPELAAAITPRTKMIVLNTPHNPIGKIFTPEELTAIGNLCVEHNIIILSDEVYDTLHYVPFSRIASMSPEFARLTLTVGSAGKSFYVTGWRVGWLVGPAHLIEYVAAAHTRICYTTVSPLQEAIAVGIEQAPNNEFWDKSRADLKGKMDRFNAIWNELGLPYTEPEGGYFVLVNMGRVRIPENYEFPENIIQRPRDFKLCWFLIQEIGVAAIPPSEFCTDENAYLVEDYMRFAVCKNDDVLEAAKERLRGLSKYIT